MDFIRNLSPRLSFIIYAAAAATIALFWLVIPQYSIHFGWNSTWLNGWKAMVICGDLRHYFLAFLLLGNFVLPGVALALSWLKKELDWLWTSIAFGFFFTMGVVVSCYDMSLTVVWFFLFLIGSAWAAFAFMRRGLPASF